LFLWGIGGPCWNQSTSIIVPTQSPASPSIDSSGGVCVCGVVCHPIVQSSTRASKCHAHTHTHCREEKNLRERRRSVVAVFSVGSLLPPRRPPCFLGLLMTLVGTANACVHPSIGRWIEGSIKLLMLQKKSIRPFSSRRWPMPGPSCSHAWGTTEPPRHTPIHTHTHTHTLFNQPTPCTDGPSTTAAAATAAGAGGGTAARVGQCLWAVQLGGAPVSHHTTEQW
jgi:hypothetical protein